MTTVVGQTIRVPGTARAIDDHLAPAGQKGAETPKRPFEVPPEEAADTVAAENPVFGTRHSGQVNKALQEVLLVADGAALLSRGPVNAGEEHSASAQNSQASLSEDARLQIEQQNLPANVSPALALQQDLSQRALATEQVSLSPDANAALAAGQSRAIRIANPAQNSAVLTSASAANSAASASASHASPLSMTHEVLMPAPRRLAGAETGQIDLLSAGPQETALKEVASVSAERPQLTTAAPNLVINQELSGSRDSRGDGPRLEGIRILNQHIEDVVAEEAANANKKQQVKSIDLQLQPNDLGRVALKMSTTSEGLVVQIAPQLQQTASLLTDNQLALQRVLNAVGAGSEVASVRIIEPQADVRDGANSGLDSGENFEEAAFEANSNRFFQDHSSERGNSTGGTARDDDAADNTSMVQSTSRLPDDIYL